MDNWPEPKRNAQNKWPDDEVIIEEQSLKENPKLKDLKLSGKLNTMAINFEQNRRKVQRNENDFIPNLSLKNKMQTTVQTIKVAEVFKTAEELEQERLEELDFQKQGDSMWLTDQFVDNPGKVIMCGGFVIFLFVVLCLSF